MEVVLSLDDVSPAIDYTHIAFSVSDGAFETTVKRLTDANIQIWKNNGSEGNSLYFLDPDGHKLELHDGDLVSRLKAVELKPYSGWTRLDVSDD